MNSEAAQFEFALRSQRIFRWLRHGIVFAALGFGISSTIWPQYTVPLIVTLIVIAGVVGAVFGWTLPNPEGSGDSTFSSNLWVRLADRQESDIHQPDLFNKIVPDVAARRKVYRIETDKGPIRILHIERFLELLVTRSLDDAGKITDHALGMAWRKCCNDLDPELQPVFNAIFREAFKMDMNGNVIRLISRVGEKLIAELRPEEKLPSQGDAPFHLVAEQPKKKKPGGRQPAK
jgi:hypothetical protein